MTVPNTKIGVRDARRTGWFRIDNELFRNGWAAAIGSTGVAVYAAIALHADNKTQQARPSYRKLCDLTGLGRTSIHKSVHELEAWGLIRVQPRKNSRGQTSHLYTLLDKSTWKTEATVKVRDRATGKLEDVTKNVKPITAEVASGDENPNNTDDSGLPDEPPGVCETVGGCASDEWDGRYQVNGGSTLGGPELDSGNETHGEEDRRERKHHHQALANDDDGFLSFSAASWVLEKRALGQLELNRFKQYLALTLLQSVAPEFHGMRKYVAGLGPRKLDRLGITLIMLSSANTERWCSLSNMPGFIRSKVDKDDWEDSEDFALSQHIWMDFCNFVVGMMRSPISRIECIKWLMENGLQQDLVYDLEDHGLSFAEGDFQTEEDNGDEVGERDWYSF